jgi:hypothetical protein
VVTHARPAPKDPALDALAKALLPEPGRFDDVWQQMRVEYRTHLRRDADLSSDFEYEALEWARNRKVLRVFAALLIKEGLDREVFPERLDAVLEAGSAQLQTFQDGVFRPRDALLSGKGLLLACDHVCRIDVDGTVGAGTGVLVRPTLVATAAHVVWPLLARDGDGELVLRADGSVTAAADTLGRISLTFGDVEDYLPAPPDDADRAPRTTRLSGQVAALHEDWLAWGSRATARERSNALFDVRDVSGITLPDGPWDVVLLRLATARRMRGGSNVLAAPPPAKPFPINVLHHPNGGVRGGQPLMWSVGTLDEQLGNPPLRCLHDANTVEGSSGAPVYDADWRIVALHQGGQRQLQSAQEATGLPASSRNRAVPILQWRNKLDALELAADVPLVTELRTSPDLGAAHPVIGRRETQRRLQAACRDTATTADRLLVVQGEPGTGLRFTKRLVREVVSGSGGVVAALDVANAVGDDATGLAGRVAAVLATRLTVSDDDLGLTTAQRRLRDDVIPQLADQVATIATGRAVWLVLEGLDAACGEPSAAMSTFVSTLLHHLERVPSLRLVLVGWAGWLPPGLEGSVECLRPPTAEDVAALVAPAGRDPQELVPIIAGYLAGLAHADPPTTGYPAALQAHALLRPLLHAATAGPAGTGGSP